MAFDFKYKATLVFTHPSMDVSEISQSLFDFTPSKAITCGDARKFKSGSTRPASVTVWECQLHDDNLVSSESMSITTLLEINLRKLNKSKYRKFISKVCEQGSARLEIVWGSTGVHSSNVIEPGVLLMLGEIGLSLDLEFYEHNSNFLKSR